MHFQRQGCFLTDARTHGGGSGGSPVARRRLRDGTTESPLARQLPGLRSTRMDVRPRDHDQHESPRLDCACYADVLLRLAAGR